LEAAAFPRAPCIRPTTGPQIPESGRFEKRQFDFEFCANTPARYFLLAYAPLSITGRPSLRISLFYLEFVTRVNIASLALSTKSHNQNLVAGIRPNFFAQKSRAHYPSPKKCPKKGQQKSRRITRNSRGTLDELAQ
jgi:hypothetical protein